MAYLMKIEKMDLLGAHSLVKSKRQFIRPNPGFWKQLVDYEKRLHGENSIIMVESDVGM